MNVNIEVFNIARTMVDREQVRKWLDHTGIPLDEGDDDPGAVLWCGAYFAYCSTPVERS